MSNIQTVQITSKGIENSLKRYNAFEAIAEYVWNGFDAEANKVEIQIEENELETVSAIIIKDNGTGIDKQQLDVKFKPFYQSEKEYDPKNKHSDTHGKNGVGRLTFFKFCNAAKWTTIYSNASKNYKYSIDVDSTSLENYTGTVEQETSEGTGTTVIFYGVENKELTIESITHFLINEFCWYLELRKNEDCVIYINDKVLNYSSIVSERIDCIFEYEPGKTIFDVEIIVWKEFLEEYSKYYFIDSNDKELGKENTTLNNKGDKFYHSVYIKSSLFDDFDLISIVPQEQVALIETKNKQCYEFQFLISSVNQKLKEIRKPFLQRSAKKVAKELDIISAFPNFDKSNTYDQFRKHEVESAVQSIYCAEPKIFSRFQNKEQKNTLIRLLDLILQSGDVKALFEVLNEIIDMDDNDRHDLAEILKFTRMSNITRMIKLIKDRYQAVSDLKSLVFNPDLGADEVIHIQKYIEQHYWIFGEQYNLVTAAEPNFVQALKRFLSYLHKEYDDIDIEHSDKYKQMDIFAIRQDAIADSIHNIVVELKHPNVSLGETQLSQVKKYMSVVLSASEFNAPNMFWEFYLVGNRFNNNDYIKKEIENNKHHGERSLVFRVDNYKIFVKTWSELFAEFELRHKYLNDKLHLRRDLLQHEYANADDVLSAQETNTAVQPKEMEKV